MGIGQFFGGAWGVAKHLGAMPGIGRGMAIGAGVGAGMGFVSPSYGQGRLGGAMSGAMSGAFWGGLIGGPGIGIGRNYNMLRSNTKMTRGNALGMAARGWGRKQVNYLKTNDPINKIWSTLGKL